MRFMKEYLLLINKQMPCACLIPVPSYPETADWGPILWSILHGLAEKAGQGILKADEIREWQKFIKITGDVLPCDLCRAHFKEFVKKNPSSQITSFTQSQINVWVKSWFWNLHNEVNISRGVPIFEYDALTPTYSNVSLTDLLYRLTPVMKKAIQLNGVPFMTWTLWVSSFKMLRSVLAV